ncbi:hypothetical protein TGAM01_v207972 [Trichoderma gamsii]|uniref:Uncharacterized protein n=1 Tax=Trichoderma gamsii TaxID=398673 RepID=A0A2P4ZFY2_9HYPO|nr:hypothetical protein TGAM01_v207972 [Trichoderma gamsii]PON23199.1 hypothetical protein TGAM01_v207972 [Trichoderma gamsii]
MYACTCYMKLHYPFDPSACSSSIPHNRANIKRCAIDWIH